MRVKYKLNLKILNIFLKPSKDHYSRAKNCGEIIETKLVTNIKKSSPFKLSMSIAKKSLVYVWEREKVNIASAHQYLRAVYLSLFDENLFIRYYDTQYSSHLLSGREPNMSAN